MGNSGLHIMPIILLSSSSSVLLCWLWLFPRVCPWPSLSLWLTLWRWVRDYTANPPLSKNLMYMWKILIIYVHSHDSNPPCRKWWKTITWYATWMLVRLWATQQPSAQTRLARSPPTAWLLSRRSSAVRTTRPCPSMNPSHIMLQICCCMQSVSTLPTLPACCQVTTRETYPSRYGDDSSLCMYTLFRLTWQNNFSLFPFPPGKSTWLGSQ